MTTIKCQYTGIEFETQSARAKNHPKVAGWLADASKAGLYGAALEEIELAKVLGAKTIEDFEAAVNKFYADRKARQEKHVQQMIEANRHVEEQKKAREAQNALLRQHGYRWSKTSQQDEEDGFGEAGWHLYAPDGPEVSVKQALDEIARGREVVRGEIAAAEKAAQDNQDKIAQAVAEKENIVKAFWKTGEMPELDKYPQGENVLDTRDAYGTGSVFTITDEHIYFIEVHGMDGDDWNKNNIARHAKGWRLPADPALIARIWAVRDVLVENKAKLVITSFGLSEITK